MGAGRGAGFIGTFVLLEILMIGSLKTYNIFFAKMLGMLVNGEEDRAVWMILMKETFSKKSLYANLEKESSTSF